MVSVLPVRATTRSQPPRACPVRAEAVPTATVPVVRVLQQVPVDRVPAVPARQQAQAVPAPQQVPVDPARVHHAPQGPVETVLRQA